MRPGLPGSFSFPICCFIQHSTTIPHHCFLPTVLSIYPNMHPPRLNLALCNKCLKIHSLMFLKHSILARIMRHFGGRLSFPQFVIPMTTNIFTIPTNLPFRFWYHLPLPGPRSSRSTNLFWILISIHPIVSHLLIMSTTLLVNPPLLRSLGTSPPMAISAQTFQNALFQMTM
jgi:hypothetical protein